MLVAKLDLSDVMSVGSMAAITEHTVAVGNHFPQYFPSLVWSYKTRYLCLSPDAINQQKQTKKKPLIRENSIFPVV